MLVGLQRKIIFFLFAIVGSILIFIEYKRPDLVVGYESELIRYIDLLFGFLICLVSIVVLIAVLIDCYEEKNKQIEEAKEKRKN